MLLGKAVANSIVANYEKSGKIVRTNSVPRTNDRPAEHFIAAILGAPGLMEAVMARLRITDGVGSVIVRSHRAYGSDSAEKIGTWFQENGPTQEQTLMSWAAVPSLESLGENRQAPAAGP